MADLSQFYKFIDEGDYHQANNLLSELELDEKELLLNKTVLLFREQKFDEALENCESKKELSTDYMLGTVYFVNGQYEKAIPFLIDPLKPYIIDLNLKSKSLKWNCFFSEKDKQNMKQRNLVYSFCRLIKVINSETDKDRLEIAIEILYKLRYFIKVDDFSEEKELRMLELVNPKDADIEKSNNVLYKDYLDILKYDSLEKIILGPKIEKPQVMKELATKKLLVKDSNVLVEISTAPLA